MRRAPRGFRPIAGTLAVGALWLGMAGCSGVREGVSISAGMFPRDDLIADTLDANRRGADAIGTIHDFEVAENIAYAGLGQLEGLHRLRPDDNNGLYLLTRAWSGAAFAFMLDSMERAEEAGHDTLAAYHADRARAGFKRARFYGVQLLNRRAEGFEGAQKNAETLEAWLKENYTEKEYADEMLWLGYAWLGEVSVDTESPETVADLWVGVELLKHVARLDETIQHGTVHTILGAYHARNALAELDVAKTHFDRALELGGDKMLATKLTMATRYYCMKKDRANYNRLLNEIVAAEDPFPEQRLTNIIAKRKARRYLGNPLWQEECGFDV